MKKVDDKKRNSVIAIGRGAARDRREKLRTARPEIVRKSGV
jgi:hypothetical protein